MLQIMQIVAYLLGVAFFVIMLKADIRIIRHDLSNLKIRQDALNEAFQQLTTVLSQVAVQSQRLTAIEEDIRELRHGNGYIVKKD